MHIARHSSAAKDDNRRSTFNRTGDANVVERTVFLVMPRGY